jgi:hypothetical protein
MAGGVDFVTHRYATKVQVRRKKEMGLALFFHRSSSVHWPRGAAADRRLAPLRSEREGGMDTLMGFGFPHTAQRTFFPFLSSSFYLRLIARKIQPFFLFSFLVSLRHRSFGFEKGKEILCRCYPF